MISLRSLKMASVVTASHIASSVASQSSSLFLPTSHTHSQSWSPVGAECFSLTVCVCRDLPLSKAALRQAGSRSAPQ